MLLQWQLGSDDKLDEIPDDKHSSQNDLFSHVMF